MIITSIQELRLASPAHALDSIDGLLGFIDNSEHDFLEDKLGTPLYTALCQWYDQNNYVRSNVADYQTGYWNRLLLLAQRCVAFDALGRSAGMQGVSVNNAGINQMVAEDYPKADEKAIATYRETSFKEAHAALNQLLRQLEQWCKESNKDKERQEIATKWKESRYYYLAAALLIPSCEVLQSYLNIYDSREKFIQLLPDLQFIQEEQIAPSVGETLMAALVSFSTNATVPSASPEGSSPAATVPEASAAGIASALVPLFDTVLHRLRKVMAALLAGRTAVLKYTKEQKVQFHDDGVRMFETAINYLRANQDSFPETLVKDAPWYVAPQPKPAPAAKTVASASPEAPCASCSKKAALWTPPLL
jgi:hypothetical protein